MLLKNHVPNLKNSEFAKQLMRRREELKVYLKSSDSSKQPSQKFVIFGQGRTGSKLLCTLLNCHPRIHCDNEILYHHIFYPSFYIQKKAAACLKDIYGFKVKIYQLTKDQNIKEPKKFLLNLIEEDWKIIYLKRNNIFRHALSSLVAEARDQWHVRSQLSNVEKPKVYIDCARLIKIMEGRVRFLEDEEGILFEIPHTSISYEEDLLNSSCHQATLDKIFRFLEIEPCFVQAPLSRTVSENLASVLENYDEVISRVSQTEYARFLPH